eukprot:4935129-Amphidinium_carterae.1
MSIDAATRLPKGSAVATSEKNVVGSDHSALSLTHSQCRALSADKTGKVHLWDTTGAKPHLRLLPFCSPCVVTLEGRSGGKLEIYETLTAHSDEVRALLALVWFLGAVLTCDVKVGSPVKGGQPLTGDRSVGRGLRLLHSRLTVRLKMNSREPKCFKATGRCRGFLRGAALFCCLSLQQGCSSFSLG